MSHSYASQYPANIPAADGIKAFFEAFYKISDTPDIHDVYADSFTSNATLIMGSKKHVGREEILQMRRGLWAAAPERLHTPQKVFPFGPGASEVMIYGTVEYRLNDGKKVDWAARVELVKEDGTWKMQFYQVYINTAPTQNAK